MRGGASVDKAPTMPARSRPRRLGSPGWCSRSTRAASAVGSNRPISPTRRSSSPASLRAHVGALLGRDAAPDLSGHPGQALQGAQRGRRVLVLLVRILGSSAELIALLERQQIAHDERYLLG